MSGPFKRPLAGLKVQSLKKSNQLLRSLLRKFKKTRLTFDLGRNKDHFYGRRAKLLPAIDYLTPTSFEATLDH